jgi:uncharacterized protein (UPF0548 family)
MLLFRKPSAEAVGKFLKAQSRFDFTYPEVGATASTLPEGYVVDHTRVRLGSGEAAFNAAREAIERWDQLRLGWVDVGISPGPTRAGDMVAIIARFGRIWWLNACRIIDVIDDDQGAVRRFGLRYGTLPDHAAVGEERFLVDWNRDSDEVCYDVLAFSRPHLPLARIGYSVMRRVQKHFGKVSAAKMIRIVRERVGSPTTRPDS